MPAKKWTDEQRQAALDAYVEAGPAEAERRTGIPRKTIASWAKRAGMQTDAPIHSAAAIKAAEMSWAKRRLEIADLAGQVAATAYQRALDAKDPRDLKQLTEAASVAIQSAQLTSGAATSRSSIDLTDPKARLALVQEITGRTPPDTQQDTA